jgi:hypothetical protein
LAHLPLALESRDGKAKAYDAPQHHIYVSRTATARRRLWSLS